MGMTFAEQAAFVRAHFTAEALAPKLQAAMAKAGVSVPVSLENVSESTDPWADYGGVEVVTLDEETRERAIKWITAYAAQVLARTPYDRRPPYVMNYPESRKGRVYFCRYSLGD